MTREEAIEVIKDIYNYTKWDTYTTNEARTMAIKALEQEPILDKIRADIEMYEADCRLQGGPDECEKCNSNVFGSIYRIIDKYIAESEDKNEQSDNIRN